MAITGPITSRKKTDILVITNDYMPLEIKVNHQYWAVLTSDFRAAIHLFG